MKKQVFRLLAPMLALTLTACGGTPSEEVPDATGPVDTPGITSPAGSNQVPAEGSNILIAYFSLWDNAPWGEATDTDTSASVVVENGDAVGTNEYVARMIQEAAGGDLYAILAAEPYPADFDAVVDANHQEDSRAISNVADNMEQYDTVFIGYPVWATTLPQAVQTFLESCDFSGKIVIPFCTHDGYGAGNSFSTVAQMAAGAETLQGLAIEAKDVPDAQDTVAQWIQGLGIVDGTKTQDGTAIRITTGDTELEGILYDSDMARQFIAQLPQTISMSNYGGREVYGGIDQEITVEGAGQLRFENGDITYCPTNNTAAIFYAQTDRPNLTMEVYPIGKVTSDLSIFPGLPSRVEITFEIIEP